MFIIITSAMDGVGIHGIMEVIMVTLVFQVLLKELYISILSMLKQTVWYGKEWVAPI